LLVRRASSYTPAANMDKHLQKMTVIGLCLIVCVFDAVTGQALTPPNFNLAVRRRIEATATCGKEVITNAPLSEPELFCKLTGANPDKDEMIGDFEVIQGQLCDYCDPREPSKTHDAESAVDGTEKWWQSPPLSRGLQFNEVNLTISLGQVGLL
jgi:laminin, alpha 3/5